MKPTIGRSVHCSFINGRDQRVVRPATIVAVWGDECVNLQVLTDGANDAKNNGGGTEAPNTIWKTSVLLKPEGYEPSHPQEQFWFWPPRV